LFENADLSQGRLPNSLIIIAILEALQGHQLTGGLMTSFDHHTIRTFSNGAQTFIILHDCTPASKPLLSERLSMRQEDWDKGGNSNGTGAQQLGEEGGPNLRVGTFAV